MSWSFVENISVVPILMSIGLETREKVMHQLEVDIHRLDIEFNGELVKSIEQLSDNSLDVLRCCTQAVFVIPLEYLVSIFPDFHIVHGMNDTSVKIQAYVDKCKSGFWGWYKNSKEEFVISTSFSALRKVDLECCFYINMQYVFEIGKSSGMLVFQVIKK
jgi:hypothetical protein